MQKFSIKYMKTKSNDTLKMSNTKGGGVAQVVECLPRKIPHTTIKLASFHDARKI
jgi:hypothetical protein